MGITSVDGIQRSPSLLDALFASPSRAASALGLSIDVKRDYGASGSSASTTGSMTSGSKTLTLTAAEDFQNGQGISVAGAGASGALLVTTIDGGAGTTTLTLADAAGTTVSAATVQHDDTAAIQAAIDAAQNQGGGVVYLPPGSYLLSSSLQLPSGVSLRGAGSYELYGSQGSATTLNNSINLPTIPPYLTGSVLVQTSAGVNILEVTGASSVVNLCDFGMRFEKPFQNTGHAIYAVPPTINAGGYDNGIMGFKFDNIKIYGHDGDHYAVYAVNPIYGSIKHFFSWGGGIYHFENNSGVGGHYGNMQIGFTYGKVINAGAAHAIRLKSTTAMLNEIGFFAVQVGVVDMGLSGVSPPTSAQYTMNADSATANISFVNASWETNVGSPYSLPATQYFIDPSAYIANDTGDNAINFPITTSFNGPGSPYNGTRSLHTDLSLKLKSIEPAGSIWGLPSELYSGSPILAGAVTDGSNGWVFRGPVQNDTPSQSTTGTSGGSIIWAMPERGLSTKRVLAYFKDYENDTTTNQTITFPTAYTYTPAVATNTTGLTVSASTTALTITAPNSTTTYSGVVEVVGI